MIMRKKGEFRNEEIACPKVEIKKLGVPSTTAGYDVLGG
jgi:hypothetical protein